MNHLGLGLFKGPAAGSEEQSISLTSAGLNRAQPKSWTIQSRDNQLAFKKLDYSSAISLLNDR